MQDDMKNMSGSMWMQLSDEGDLGVAVVLPSGEVLPPMFQRKDERLAESGAQNRKAEEKEHEEEGAHPQRQSVRPMSAASRIEGAPRPPLSAAPSGSKLAHERAHSARRIRSTERALAGADSAVRWPSLGIDHSGSTGESDVATAGQSEEGELFANIVDLDELEEQSEVTTPRGPMGARMERRESMQSSRSVHSVDGPFRAQSSAAASSVDDAAGLREPELAAFESATHQDKAAYAGKYRTEDNCSGEEEARTIRRRFFSDLKGPMEPRAFEIVLAQTKPDSSAKDYLTWYYCDFIEANAPVGPAPPFHDDDTTSTDELLAWLHEFKPRTRADAYPMLQVAVCAIQKIVSKEVTIRNEQAETLIRLK